MTLRCKINVARTAFLILILYGAYKIAKIFGKTLVIDGIPLTVPPKGEIPDRQYLPEQDPELPGSGQQTDEAIREKEEQQC